MGSQHHLGSRVGSCLIQSFEGEKTNPKKINMSVSADDIIKICEIYDWDGKGEIDMYYCMDIIKKVCVKYGQTDDTGKKFAKFDEVVKKVNEAVKEPEHSGNYHDYVELCKLYDKNENGTMMLAELENFLTNLADEIPKEDTLALLAELADPEDEDGFIPYVPFIDRLVGKA